MQWIRVDANLDDHPKSVEAGFWGTVVIQVIWRLAKRHGERGHLGARYVTQRHLRHVTRCPEELSRYLLEGLMEARDAGFLVINDDGSVDVHDWDEMQWDATHAERQRKYRERKMLARDGGDESCDGVTRVTRTPPHPDPTPTPQEGKEGKKPEPSPDKSGDPPILEQEAGQKGKRTMKVKPVNSMTDPTGLDNPDLIRRTFARLWKETVGEGREYPSGGEPDRMAARKLLDYHRQSKIREPWKTWVYRALRVYLSTRGDQRLEQDTWPLRYLPSKMTSIVRETGDHGPSAEATHA